jgi:hypothetical protein
VPLYASAHVVQGCVRPRHRGPGGDAVPCLQALPAGDPGNPRGAQGGGGEAQEAGPYKFNTVYYP